MINIRKDVFETNSSSMHTLVLTNEETWVSEEEIKEFKIDPKAILKEWIVWNKDHTGYYLTIEGDNFGREFRLLTLWHAKLQYVAAAIGARNATKLVEVLKEYLGDDFIGILLSSANLDSDRETNDTCPAEDPYKLDYCFGEIDHQSHGMILNAMSLIDSDFKEAMKKLIFNNKYVIVIDGDETQAFDEMLISGLMEDTYFTHIFYEGYKKDENNKYDWEQPFYKFISISNYLNGSPDIDEE